MPKNNQKPVTIVGIRWIAPYQTRLTFSNGTTTEVRLLTTVGWDTKLRDAPIIMVGEKQYANEIPRAEMLKWVKQDIAHFRSLQEKQEKSLAELVKSDELISTLPVKRRNKK